MTVMTVYVRTVLGDTRALRSQQPSIDKFILDSCGSLLGAVTKIRNYHGDMFPPLALDTRCGRVVNLAQVVEVWGE